MVRGILRCQKLLCCRCNVHQKMSIVFYHMQETSEDERVSDWYERGFPKLLKLCHLFRNVDQIDGRLINVDDGNIITNESVHTEFKAFKSLARHFTKFRTPHQDDENDVEPVLLNSLTKVCDILGVSAQQRSKMRLSICPQITQHHIFRGALEEVLKNLRTDVDSLLPHSRATMIVQIVAIVLKIFYDYSPSSDPSSSSWMRLASTKKSHGHSSYKWGDILEMFNDLSQCLAHEKKLMHNNLKIQAMKEGLYQLKEVLIDRDIGYKEGRHQEYLVQKKLTKNLGHSSKCLFTLLLYYLYGTVSDIELDFCKADQGRGGSYRVSMGKFFPADNDKLVSNGIKQLDRALKLFRLVWETANMKGKLELHCHLWCAANGLRKVTYRGNTFTIHRFEL